MRSGTEADTALREMHRLIADGGCSAVSMDVFDTVLWRRVPRPTDAFGLLRARLRDAGRCPEWLTDAAFRQMRIAAEQRARAGRGALGSEVSLFDIWRAMPLSQFGDVSVQELVNAEVELERELTVVDLDIAEVLQRARKDLPVVLVSDTYFTDDQLSYLLNRLELGSLDGVRVFRSQEYGTDKASGLWPMVLQCLDLRPAQVVHIGDNEIADHEVPRSLGIRTVHYRRVDDSLAPVLEREHRPVDPFGPFDQNLDPEHGDFGLTALRAKTVRRAPARGTATEIAWRYGGAVLGPVLTGFAEWVARTAYEDGTRVVWCPMREGELLSELVNNAARAREWPVEARPVWLSRHVTSVAGLDPVDAGSVQELIRRSHQLTVRQLLSILRLRPGDVPALAHRLDTVLDDGTTIDLVSRELTETPHLRNHLAVRTTATRERLLASLRRCGALDGPELTLVDLGWGGTIQVQLAKILRLAGIDIALRGLYLVTDERSIRAHMAGLRVRGYLAQAGHPRAVAGAVARSPEVIEQSVAAMCGSLLDFAHDGTPVLGPCVDHDAQDTERRAARDGIVAFQREWNRYLAASADPWPELTGSARDQLGGILVAALRAPTADEAQVFGNWRHDDNFGSSVVTRVLPEDLMAAVPYLSPRDLDDFDMRDVFWPRLIAASDTHLGAAVRALDSGLVDGEMFEPAGVPFETRLRWRAGDGGWHEGPRRPIRINHNGLSFVRLRLEARDVTEVALALPGQPAIVRVDWIEAKVIGGNQPPRVVRWDTTEDMAGLPLDECVYLGGNMVQFDAPHSAVRLPLADRSATPVGSVQISVGFAMLPRSTTLANARGVATARAARLAQRAYAVYRRRGLVGVADGVRRVASRRLGGVR